MFDQAGNVLLQTRTSGPAPLRDELRPEWAGAPPKPPQVFCCAMPPQAMLFSSALQCVPVLHMWQFSGRISREWYKDLEVSVKATQSHVDKVLKGQINCNPMQKHRL